MNSSCRKPHRPEAPVSRIQELLRYDPETGVLIWTVDRRGHRGKAKAGSVAGCLRTDGYIIVGIEGRVQLGHRIAWALTHGEYPEHQVDHINGIRHDNRLVNLRSVTNQENTRNRRLSSNNTSGHMGVCWHRKSKKWCAQMCIQGNYMNLGYYDNIEEAVAARKQAEILHGFHPNHGRAYA